MQKENCYFTQTKAPMSNKQKNSKQKLTAFFHLSFTVLYTIDLKNALGLKKKSFQTSGLKKPYSEY